MLIYKIEITILAEEEYASGYKFYEQRQQGLGDRFELEVEKVISQLNRNPYLFQRKYKHYREAVLRRFPYYIVYEIIGNSVIILSFFHGNRNPKTKLKKRDKS